MRNKVFFIHQGKAHLPEIIAYSKFFSSKGFETHEILYQNLMKMDTDFLKDCILWYFMGFYNKKILSKLTIHDYRSLSTGSFAIIKDFLKRTLNLKPDLRVFLNEEVKENLNFNDEVPYFFINMGLPSTISTYVNLDVEPEYDFIYVGAITYER